MVAHQQKQGLRQAGALNPAISTLPGTRCPTACLRICHILYLSLRFASLLPGVAPAARPILRFARTP